MSILSAKVATRLSDVCKARPCGFRGKIFRAPWGLRYFSRKPCTVRRVAVMAARIGHRLLCPIRIYNQLNRRYMSVICTRCGSTNVACEAIVNPNGNVFRRYMDESFVYGQCEDCGTYPELTDPDEVKMGIDRLYQEFKSYSDTEPDYANCRIVYKDDGNDLNVKISLKADDKAAAMDENIFYHCDSISDLKSLAEYGGGDFILAECFQFDKWTDKDCFSNNKCL